MKYIIIFLFTLTTISGYGQTLSDLFKSMPQEILPGFTEADKTMLLVDTSLTVIPYALGEIERVSYNDTYLYLRTSDVGTLQLKLLPLVNNTYIICMIKTVCAKACDSNIRFFSTDWKPLDSSSLLPKINADLFFNKDNIKDSNIKDRKETEIKFSKEANIQDNNINDSIENEQYSNVESLFDIEPISAKLQPNSNELILKLDYKTHLSAENVTQIESIIKQDSITLHWNKSSFQ